MDILCMHTLESLLHNHPDKNGNPNACIGGLSGQTGLRWSATAWHVGYIHFAKPFGAGGGQNGYLTPLS